MAPRPLLWLAFTCALQASSRGQELLARELAARRDATARGSRDGFELGCDQFDAELEYDVRAALATAEQLHASALAERQADRAVVACALVELAQSTLEGPARATRCADEPALSSEAPTSYRVRLGLARSRSACLRDDSATELTQAIAALDQSRQIDNERLWRNAIWNAHHATDDVSGAFASELIDELHEFASRQPPERTPARLLVHEFAHDSDELPIEQQLERLNELRRTSVEQGDRRALESVFWGLAVRRESSGDIDGALAALEDAAATATAAGHRRALVNTRYMSAAMALDNGRIDDAARFLAVAEQALEGCGMPNMEGLLLDTRFKLALARRDGEELLALAGPMEAQHHSEQEKMRELARLQEQLLSSQRTRLDYERKLDEERARSDRALTSMTRWLWGGALLALTIFAATLTRARRRLLLSNEALRREIERAEGEARAREALEERMRRLERTESLGLFASGVAHDFNNLMVGVIGNAELLRAGESAPARARQLDVIVEAGERAARLCAQLQTFVGDGDMELEPLDLAAIARESGPVLAATASLVVDVEHEDEPLPILGLRVQLEQALLNLVSNARDAHAKHVRVRVGAVELGDDDFAAAHVRGAARAGRFACVDVEDDGDGMSDELIERIFDPFFTTRFPGRGLGLAVVFGAMRRHDGLVLVTSAPGRGSRFRFCIPAAEDGPHDALDTAGERLSPRATPRSISALADAVDAFRLVIIDDEAHVRDFVRLALEARGHSVAALDDGCRADEAQALVREGARRVALIDLTMPTQEGRDLALRLRALDPQLAIVLMSGHAAGPLQDIAERLDADGAIAKPFTAGELEHVLALAIERRTKLARASAS